MTHKMIMTWRWISDDKERETTRGRTGREWKKRRYAFGDESEDWITISRIKCVLVVSLKSNPLFGRMCTTSQVQNTREDCTTDSVNESEIQWHIKRVGRRTHHWPSVSEGNIVFQLLFPSKMIWSLKWCNWTTVEAVICSFKWDRPSWQSLFRSPC